MKRTGSFSKIWENSGEILENSGEILTIPDFISWSLFSNTLPPCGMSWETSQKFWRNSGEIMEKFSDSDHLFPGLFSQTRTPPGYSTGAESHNDKPDT